MSDQPQPFDLIGASVLAGRATPMPAPADLEPRTPLEQALARLWQAVLKVPSFSRLDNFFALGGDSLLATQVVARVRDELGLEVPLRQLFETPTLAGMADKLEAVQRQALGLETPPLRPMPRHGPIPLSLSQERMWFIQQLDPTSAAYNVPGAMRLTGDLDVGALRGALAAIVRRHESLRTAFTVVDGQPAQVIRPAADVEIAEIDLRGEPEAEREARARALAEAEASRPFDLSRAPLARLAVLRLAAADWIVVFNVHHTVSDAWSMGVFMREMTTLYAAQHAGRPAELPPLAVQYADFAIWQRGWLQGELLERQIAYWRKQLAGCPPLRLAADHPRPAVQTYRGAQHWVNLPPGLLGDLRRLCQAGDATVFMGLLAAFQILLGRYSGQADFAVGVPIANRRWQAAEEIIGSLVNTLVLRADLAGDPEFTTLLARVRETALGAFAHQDMPFAKLVAELQPERDLSRSPLIQVMFNVINVPMPELTFPGLELKVFELERYAAQFDLTLTVIDLEWMQRVSLEYNTDLFDAPTIEWMLDHYVALLLGLVQDPGRRLSELALLTPAERELLLHTWNATAAAAPAEPSLAQAFAAQAARTPRAVAVWDEHRRLTYAELDQRANQLARYLRAHGVGAESRVAVCLERSAETVAALLGVLKAGGAFVPLDPAYPRDRLAFMLQDSAAAVLLTQSHLAAQLPAPEGRLICLDTVAEAVARESAAELEPAALTPESAAYVIYTSGSTGQPKGVVGPHRAALNRFAWMWERYPFSPLDVACQKTALSFVDSIWELFGPLLRGVPTVVIPEAVVKDPARLVAALAAERVTRLVLVPSLLQTLLETVPDLAERLPDLQLWVS
ncbi:MAG: AMP-binding protein, partial [Anaerolineales bacterium]|nr:AMP-binding protein [Anaerolineales bacterium]